MIIGGIKYKKSTVRNQSLFQKIKFCINRPPKGLNEEPTCLKSGGFFQTSQLNSGRFGYI
jgi:hypothetical protein